MTAQPLLGRLYTMGSLETDDHGFHFRVKNRLFAATLTAVDRLVTDGVELALADVTLSSDGAEVPAVDLGDGIVFDLRDELTVRVAGARLAEGPHEFEVSFRAEPFGDLVFEARGRRGGAPPPKRRRLPRDLDDDQSAPVVEARRRFLGEHTGASPGAPLRRLVRSPRDPRQHRELRRAWPRCPSAWPARC